MGTLFELTYTVALKKDVNEKNFIDALRVIDDEEVTLYMVNPKAPCFIKDDAGTYVYLILPVNFNAATV